jgi:hypothetical protein
MRNTNTHSAKNAVKAAQVTNHIKARKRQGMTHKDAKTEAYLRYQIKNQTSPDVNRTWLERAREAWPTWQAYCEYWRQQSRPMTSIVRDMGA